MFTTDQSNYLHTKMREVEDDVKRTIGLDIHLSVYLRSKRIDRLLSHTESVAKMAAALSVTVEELTDKCRKADIVIRRKAIAAVMRANFPQITLTQIGEIFERDHTTIMNLLRGATNLTNTEDEEFQQLFAIALKSLEL